MMTRSFWRFAPITVAALLSACGSTESLYPQGPWGAPHIRRVYPQYSAPWGSRAPVLLDERIDTSVPDSALWEDGEPGIPLSRGRIVRLEAELPAAPVPGDYGPAPALYEPAPVEQPPLDGPLPPPGMSHGIPSPLAEATLPPAADAGVISPPRRTASFTGTWKATDERGASCRIQLSSVPSLDLYKASTSGCTNDSLKGVNAWKFAEGTVVLYSHGRVIARLSGLEASLSGSFSGSKGSLRMTR